MDSGTGDCSVCDYSYRSKIRDLILDAGRGHTSIYDLDLVIEVDSTVKTLIEYKRRKDRYNTYYIPFFEYIALLKFARKFRVDPYVVIELVDKGVFFVWKVDRFEYGRDYQRGPNGRKLALFPVSDGLTLDDRSFRDCLLEIVYGQGAV